MTGLKFFKEKLFGKRKLKFLSLSLNELENQESSLLNEIVDGKITGIIIRSAFDHDHSQKIVDQYLSTEAEQKYFFEGGSGEAFPISFSSVRDLESNSEQGLDSHFTKINKDLAQFKGSLNIETKLFDLFGKISQLHNFQKPVNPNTKLNPGTFSIRLLYPNFGGIKYHVGKGFESIYQPFYNFFNLPSSAKQLSYFTLLQKPNEGGKLKVYDARFPKFKDQQNRTLFGEGKTKSLDSFYSINIDIEVGDLIIFNGGEYWHEVTQLAGSKPRVTLGGFISLIGKNGFVWA